jgi:Zn-dependent peptidase ImmA (M78 family)
MKGSPIIGVTPAVLKWARESANMSIFDVADTLKKSVDTIQAWESGESAPTYSQLEKLAYDVYKRPLALFFMPAAPDEPKPSAEFRSLPDADLMHLSRQTTLLIRKARAFQMALVELYGERNPVVAPIWKRIQLNSRADIAETPNDDSALKIWRRAIEAQGIHVFKDSFKQKELSGFCLRHPEFPVILINNSTTRTRQIFSLLHELAHLLCDRSGISRFDDQGIEELPRPDRDIEKFCNALAAEILVPSEYFNLASRGFDPLHAEDEDFAQLADRFYVSRSVILRRFVDRGLVSIAFYLDKDREWTEQIRATRDAGGGSYYNTRGTYLSEQFLREVVTRYSRRLISKVEASDLIGEKPRNFDRFEDIVLRGYAV